METKPSISPPSKSVVFFRRGFSKCFPRYGLFLALSYCGLSSYFLLNDAKDIPPGLDAFFIFLAATGAFTLQLRYSIKGIEALLSVAANLLGFVYIAYLFSFASRISFGLPGSGDVPGAYVLLWLLAVTKFSDMGAYITGSLIGKHKMIPKISSTHIWLIGRDAYNQKQPTL